ncbi:hypothetical protein [Kribbella sp. NPDC006257]|uniref:hypothetical protein n=1 Tax=Kribbella sp. NPDC006257 TaxID=3156738 RepID=UPI0033B518A0
MTTFTAATTATTKRPMGSVLAPVSLILGPALLSLALATLHEPWIGDKPDYTVINNEHGLLMLSFNLAAAAFPFMFGSVFALTIAARRSRRLAGAGLACSILGLSAMFANAMLSVPLALMNGIDDHATLDQLAARLDSPPLVALFAFPLFVVGSLLMAAALRGAVPTWAAICVGLGGLFPIAMVTGVPVLALPIAALRIAGSVPVIKQFLSREAATQ